MKSQQELYHALEKVEGIIRVVGTIIAVGIKGEEMADCPLSMAQWKEVLYLWGN